MVAMDSGREAGTVRVLLMASGVNSLTQRVLVDLKDAGYDVTVKAVADQAQIQAAFERAEPDLVVAPYLKRAIPESVWSARPCLVLHPGIRGDRGPSSLDWAIHDGEDRWGVTVLQANAEFDAGDIWAHRDFTMRLASKSALYRHEVADAASEAVQDALWRYRTGTFTPAPLDYGCPEVRGRARPAMKPSDRTVDWSAPTAEIMRHLRCSDSSPGVSDVLGDAPYYLFGAHEDELLNGPPGTILAQRDGAICRATGDGAIWIERLKVAGPGGLKLPAAKALRGHLCHVPTLNISPGHSVEGRTFREIRYEEHRQIGYLHFEFYNGAMSTSRCRRLQHAYRWARRRPTKAIVLMGGDDLWSNGIDLTAIEAAADPVVESWRNINAIDDLVRDIITTESHLTCAAIAGNAGAGGAILALAADLVYARNGVVLNPHYQSMHLFGSEYWTYLLPRRAGDRLARELTEQCQPISTHTAKSIGLIDDTFPGPLPAFHSAVRQHLETLTDGADFDRRLRHKNQQRLRHESVKPLQAYRDEELARMRNDFTHTDYHQARRRFLHVAPSPPTSRPATPERHPQPVSQMAGAGSGQGAGR
jgi:putative two-component system protein, hydrogenase maturation factor HypX/HoxX